MKMRGAQWRSDSHLSPLAGRGRLPSGAQRSDSSRVRESSPKLCSNESPPHPLAALATSPRKRGELGARSESVALAHVQTALQR
jgi:hypothetical protein